MQTPSGLLASAWKTESQNFKGQREKAAMVNLSSEMSSFA
jgi:hypothetical protein